MKTILLLAAALSVSAPACKSPATAETIAVDLTNAVCAALEGQPLGQPWVDVACTLAQGGEQIAFADGGIFGVAPAAATPVRVVVRVPAAQLAAFLAAHSGADAGR